jgi:hypothetical protein
MNPFSQEYTEAEIEFMGLTEPQTYGNLRIQLETSHPWDYLNKKSFELTRPYPVLYEGEHQWMSLSPIEVQSHAVPIRRAVNKVAMGGLGLGYFALRVAEKPTVSSIDVYEINLKIVELFAELHGSRPGFEKFNFIMGDIMETMNDKTYDFVYLDHFPDWKRTSKYFFDWAMLIGANWTDKANYHIWCQEQILLVSETDDLNEDERWFFQQWADATSPITGKNLREEPKRFYSKNEDVVRMFFEITGRKL